MPTIELGRFSLLSLGRSFRSGLRGFFLLCGIMRIRKGPRCVPLAPAADRWCLVSKGFAPPGEDNNARREDDEKQRNGGDNQVVAEASGGGGGGGGAAAAASVAATSGCCHDNLDHRASSSAGTMERLEVDRVQRKRLTSTAAGYSRRRRRAGGPIAQGTGVISISSIIKAGVKSTKVELLSAESVITLVAKSPAKSPSTDWTPAMKSTDQPSTRLLQSLKRVCSAAETTGLTAKEAVAKIQEQGLPGLIDGGERLIVQVAKSLRSSSSFVEREERGRYFIQEPSDLDEWDNFQTAEEAVVEAKSAATDFDTVIEAAKQLQKLQEPIKADPKLGLTNKPGTGRWTLALRGKSTTIGAEKVEPASAPQKSNLSGPRCNRDDGKGWRCVRMAESGFSLCKYHRDQIRRAEIRRRKARNKSKKHQSSARPSLLHRAAAKPSNPTSKEEDVKAAVPEAEKIVDSKAIDSDNELPDHKRRRFVKAKSLKSLL